MDFGKWLKEVSFFALFFSISTALSIHAIMNDNVKWCIAGFIIIFTLILLCILHYFTTNIESGGLKEAERSEKDFNFLGIVLSLFATGIPEMAKSIFYYCTNVLFPTTNKTITMNDETKIWINLCAHIAVAIFVLGAYIYRQKVLNYIESEKEKQRQNCETNGHNP